MPRQVLPTRVLMICAAIGVATGLAGGVAGLITPFVLAVVPVTYGLVLGVHVIPGIIAQEVLRRPYVAITTHLIAGLVSSAFNPGWALRFIGTAVLFGAIQEGVAALTRYRNWGAWRFFVSAVIIGGIVAATVYVAAHLSAFTSGSQILYLTLSVAGPVAWTAISLMLGQALRRAGVAR